MWAFDGDASISTDELLPTRCRTRRIGVSFDGGECGRFALESEDAFMMIDGVEVTLALAWFLFPCHAIARTRSNGLMKKRTGVRN